MTSKNATKNSSTSKSDLKPRLKDSVGLEKFFGHRNKSPDTSQASDPFVSTEAVEDSFQDLHDVTDDSCLANLNCTKETATTNSTKQRNNKARGDGKGVASAGKLDVDPSHDLDAPNIRIADELCPVAQFTPNDFAICEKCGKRVLQWEMPEHNDFHFAQDLQRDLNDTSKTSQHLSSLKNSTTSPPRKKLKHSTATIDKYFKTR